MTTNKTDQRGIKDRFSSSVLYEVLKVGAIIVVIWLLVNHEHDHSHDVELPEFSEETLKLLYPKSSQYLVRDDDEE